MGDDLQCSCVHFYVRQHGQCGVTGSDWGALKVKLHIWLTNCGCRADLVTWRWFRHVISFALFHLSCFLHLPPFLCSSFSSRETDWRDVSFHSCSLSSFRTSRTYTARNEARLAMWQAYARVKMCQYWFNPFRLLDSTEMKHCNPQPPPLHPNRPLKMKEYSCIRLQTAGFWNMNKQTHTKRVFLYSCHLCVTLCRGTICIHRNLPSHSERAQSLCTTADRRDGIYTPDAQERHL